MMGIKKYRDVERKFYSNIVEYEKDNLLFYCVTGGLGRNDIIEGWSDVDILLVFNQYSASLFNNINKALHTNKSTIHIGVTFYSLNEFNNPKYFKDPKTYHAIELIKKGTYVPMIRSGQIELSCIDKAILKKYDATDMAKYLHDIKRQLLNQSGFDEYSVYKKFISILKIMLYKNNIIVLGYQDVLVNSNKYLQGFKMKLFLPLEIIEFPEKKNKRYYTYIELLDWIKSYKFTLED